MMGSGGKVLQIKNHLSGLSANEAAIIKG